MASDSPSPPISCPFCQAPLTERIDIEGERFLVFRCMFSPQVDPNVTDVELPEYLRTHFGSDGSGYFRATCDRLHLYVTRSPDEKPPLHPSS